MKRLFSLFTALVLAVALCAPAMADDQDNSTPTPASSVDAYVSAYTVTDAAGGEINTIEVGDRINIVLKVVDHASARYNVKAEEISARINSSAFTFTGIGEVGQLFASNDDPDQQRLQRQQHRLYRPWR